MLNKFAKRFMKVAALVLVVVLMLGVMPPSVLLADGQGEEVEPTSLQTAATPQPRSTNTVRFEFPSMAHNNVNVIYPITAEPPFRTTGFGAIHLFITNPVQIESGLAHTMTSNHIFYKSMGFVPRYAGDIHSWQWSSTPYPNYVIFSNLLAMPEGLFRLATIHALPDINPTWRYVNRQFANSFVEVGATRTQAGGDETITQVGVVSDPEAIILGRPTEDTHGEYTFTWQILTEAGVPTGIYGSSGYYRSVSAPQTFVVADWNLDPGVYRVVVTVQERPPLMSAVLGNHPTQRFPNCTTLTSTSIGVFEITPPTTTFTFTKQNHQSTPLAGATFQVFARNAAGDGWATTPQQAITSGSGNGNVTLPNLTHGGRYQLRETAAPTGFITPPATQYWDISVSATGDITVTPIGGATAFGGAQPFTAATTTATLANQPQTINVPVLKIWDDSENDAGLRPTSIQVQLMRNNQPYGSPVTLNQAVGWQYTFTNLVRYNFDVTPPIPNYFTVVEIGVPAGYSVSYSGSMNTTLTITNHHPPLPPPETINVPVTKVWAGDLPEGASHPTSVQVQLLRNGQPHRLPVTLTAALGWTYTFTGLYRYVAGTTTRYTYTVVELNIPANYSVSYSGHMDTGLVVTNTFRPPSIVTLSKELRMPAGTQLPENEFSFNFQSQMVNFWPPRAQDQWPSASLPTLSASFEPPVTTTIDGNYEYAIINIPINLSAMQWSTPGIYTFRIWETPGSSLLTNPFTVEYDRSVFYIYVHVGREDGTNMSAPLVVLGINSSRRLAAESCYTTWPHPANDCACVPVPRAESEKWELPFVNHLTRSTTFEVGKILEGDMGDPNQRFEFTVTFTLPDYAAAAHNIGVSATGFARNGILVGSARSDLGLGASYVNLQPAGNTITIPAGSRTVTRTFNLRHGDIIEFTNIPIGTVSAVTETYFDNYIQSGVATGLGNVVISNTDDYIRISGQVYAAASVTVTNTFDETPPTGVLFSNVPFGLMVALGAGALVATGAVAVVHSKKKKR